MAATLEAGPAGRPAWKDYQHTGPGTLAGRYLRLFWQPVHRAEDLPAGRAVPIRIMSEDLTLYRGERGKGGKPHVLAFRCAHRGTQLSTGWVEGDDLRCFYHGWKYDATGQCIQQPAEPKPFCQRIRIRSYPTQEYLGLIFVYLGEGDPPPLQRFPDFEDFDGILEARASSVSPCNFFNRIENDPVHVPFVHRDSRKPVNGVIEAANRVWGEETAYGMAWHVTYPSGELTEGQFLMPNISEFRSEVGAPQHSIAYRVPVDDGHYRSFAVSRLELSGEEARRYQEQHKRRPEAPRAGPAVEELGDAILAGKLRLEDARGSVGWNLFELQDYVSLVGQGVIADHDQEHLGREDATIILQRKLWERELRALANGRPLKQWRYR